MMMSSNTTRWGIVNAEYLIDILRTGGYFPKHQTFLLPEQYLQYKDLKIWVKNYLPVISDDRHEIFVELSIEESLDEAFSLLDIVGVHFISGLRQEIECRRPIGQVLETYSIPILQPLNNIPLWQEILDAYQFVVRDHAARTVIKAWFKSDNAITKEFCNEVEIGFKYQQSTQPWLLPKLASDQPWAYIISYNPSSRLFEEIPKILELQDLEVVLKEMPELVKDRLKTLSQKMNTKYKDEIKRAENEKSLMVWVYNQLSENGTYLAQLDRLITSQRNQSVIFSSILYFRWRDILINKEYKGNLKDNTEINYFLTLPKDENDLRFVYNMAIIQALYTVLFIGGPVTFIKALKEARYTKFGIKKVVQIETVYEDESDTESNTWMKKFQKYSIDIRKLLGKKLMDRKKKINDKERTKQLEKEIANSDLKKGNFNYEEFIKYCILLDMQNEELIDELENQINATSITNEKSEKTGKRNLKSVSLEQTLPKIENVKNINFPLGSEKPNETIANSKLNIEKDTFSGNIIQPELFK